MRKLVYAINLTIDGCLDHTKIGGSDEMLDTVWLNILREAGALLYGRVTYELMVPYWPDVAKDPTSTRSELEFARAFDSVEKVVFSKSLEKVEDGNSRIVRSKPEDEILKLKKQEGNSLLLGGVALPSYLIERGLVDEFIFVVHPLIVGEGRRLLGGVSLQERLQLKLVDSKVFKSGAVLLHYVKP
jgi:dihydrofolate reductase